MTRSISSTILIVLLAVTLAIPASAQDRSPGTPRSDAPADGSVAWPSGDELRRELQDISFTFRVERDSGDWLGWAPHASIVEAPAVTLGGAGNEDAGVRFSFELLRTDLLGADVDAALTALMEVAARLPLAPARADRMRRFVVDDLGNRALKGINEPMRVLRVLREEQTFDVAAGAGRVAWSHCPAGGNACQVVAAPLVGGEPPGAAGGCPRGSARRRLARSVRSVRNGHPGLRPRRMAARHRVGLG